MTCVTGEEYATIGLDGRSVSKPLPSKPAVSRRQAGFVMPRVVTPMSFCDAHPPTCDLCGHDTDSRATCPTCGCTQIGAVLMATVSITRDWGEDDGSLEVLIDVDESYPDACSEASANAIRVFTESLALLTVTEPDE